MLKLLHTFFTTRRCFTGRLPQLWDPMEIYMDFSLIRKNTRACLGKVENQESIRNILSPR